MTQDIPSQIFTRVDIGDISVDPVHISGRFAAYLHNLRIEVSEAKIALRYDPNNAMKFLQDEALLVGQLQLLDTIIADTIQTQ